MNLRVEIWYIIGRGVDKATSKDPLLGYRVSTKKFRIWVPLHQPQHFCSRSQIADNVIDLVSEAAIHGLNWRRFFFKDDPIHKWQADNSGEVETNFYNSIDDFKKEYAEYFI